MWIYVYSISQRYILPFPAICRIFIVLSDRICVWYSKHVEHILNCFYCLACYAGVTLLTPPFHVAPRVHPVILLSDKSWWNWGDLHGVLPALPSPCSGGGQFRLSWFFHPLTPSYTPACCLSLLKSPTGPSSFCRWGYSQRCSSIQGTVQPLLSIGFVSHCCQPAA
jgi:hypothetical protein